jgi:hypothetical protein
MTQSRQLDLGAIVPPGEHERSEKICSFDLSYDQVGFVLDRWGGFGEQGLECSSTSPKRYLQTAPSFLRNGEC